MTEKIQIDSVECVFDKNGLKNVISSVQWSFILTSDSGEVEKVDFWTPLSDPNPDEYIPFESLIDNDPIVVLWVEHLLSEEIRQDLRRRLEEKINPTKKIVKLGEPLNI